MADLVSWLKRGLEKEGVTPESIADALGLHLSVIYKLKNERRKFKMEELPIIARVIGEPVPIDGATVTYNYKKTLDISIESGLSVGEWFDPNKIECGKSIVVERVASKIRHRCFSVTDESMIGGCVLPNDKVLALDFEGLGGFHFLAPGMFVVVERNRGVKIERSLREVGMFDETVMLQTKPARLKPSVVVIHKDAAGPKTADNAKIIAVVRRIYRDLK